MWMGRNFDAWRHHDAPIEEVTLQLEHLTSIWQEILKREVASPS